MGNYGNVRLRIARGEPLPLIFAHIFTIGQKEDLLGLDIGENHSLIIINKVIFQEYELQSN